MAETLLFWGPNDARADRWEGRFAKNAPSISFQRANDSVDPETVDYLLAWEPPSGISGRFPNLKAIFATSAGVDQFDLSLIPDRVPVVRMFDPQIESGVVDYASFATLYLHRDIDVYRRQQADSIWQARALVAASARRVGILGIGALGRAIAERLVALGFGVAGWSRSAREIVGVDCFYGGDGLKQMLATTDILICMLPLTDATRGILDRDLFGQLPRGAALINMGRGAHLVEADLLDALNEEQLRGAVLDVLETEPPAADHPFWHDARILLTPHVAAMTNPDTAFDVLMANIQRHRNGESMVGTVDRRQGY